MRIVGRVIVNGYDVTGAHHYFSGEMSFPMSDSPVDSLSSRKSGALCPFSNIDYQCRRNSVTPLMTSYLIPFIILRDSSKGNVESSCLDQPVPGIRQGSNALEMISDAKSTTTT